MNHGNRFGRIRTQSELKSYRPYYGDSLAAAVLNSDQNSDEIQLENMPLTEEK